MPPSASLLRGTGSFRARLERSHDPVRGAACVDLAEEICSGPLDHESRFPYHPRVTLAQDVDDVKTGPGARHRDDHRGLWIVLGFR